MLKLVLTGIAGVISLSEKIDAEKIAMEISRKLKHRGKPFIFKPKVKPNIKQAKDIFFIQFYTELEDLETIRKEGYCFVLDGKIFYPRDTLLRESQPELFRGYFAYATIDNKCMRVYRDRIGIKPLFYGFTKDLVVFASERKAIRKYASPGRLPPGHVLIVEDRDIKIKPFRILTKPRPEITSEEEAIEVLSRLILESTAMLTEDSVAVMFSGGLDSSTVAKVASQFSDVHLITVGLPDSRDIIWAKKAAELLGLPIHVIMIRPEDLENYIEKTICAIDDWDPLKVMIGLPLYVACEKIHEMGFKVALAGQGADELFGGYAKYLEMAPQEFWRWNFVDIVTLAEKNLERDEHIAAANGVDLRLPYLSDEIIDFALRLPPELKIRNGVRKYVLRKTAIRLGVPSEVAFAPKKAVQYSTGVAKFVKKIAKKKSQSLSAYFRNIYENLC